MFSTASCLRPRILAFEQAQTHLCSVTMPTSQADDSSSQSQQTVHDLSAIGGFAHSPDSAPRSEIYSLESPVSEQILFQVSRDGVADPEFSPRSSYTYSPLQLISNDKTPVHTDFQYDSFTGSSHGGEVTYPSRLSFDTTPGAESDTCSGTDSTPVSTSAKERELWSQQLIPCRNARIVAGNSRNDGTIAGAQACEEPEYVETFVRVILPGSDKF
jgi:hypothetical protein